MKMNEFRKLSLEELKDAEGKLRNEIMTMRFDHAVGKLLNTGLPMNKRRQLAQVLTLLNEKNRS